MQNRERVQVYKRFQARIDSNMEKVEQWGHVEDVNHASLIKKHGFGISMYDPLDTRTHMQRSPKVANLWCLAKPD